MAYECVFRPYSKPDDDAARTSILDVVPVPTYCPFSANRIRWPHMHDLEEWKLEPQPRHTSIVCQASVSAMTCIPVIEELIWPIFHHRTFRHIIGTERISLLAMYYFTRKIASSFLSSCLLIFSIMSGYSSFKSTLYIYTLVPVAVVLAFLLPGEYKYGISKFLSQCQKCGQTIVWANMQILCSKPLTWQFEKLLSWAL